MNRFDRIVTLLILLQTKRVLTSLELAERFGVTQRTIYRDIRTLEAAGVPILSEAGIGYSLDKSYRLPPVMFSESEAVALLIAERFVRQSSDAVTLPAFHQALAKIKAVLNPEQKEHLASLEARLEVSLPARQSNGSDPWLGEVQYAVARNRVLAIQYATPFRDTAEERLVEPIGLYHYSQHWHLIGWCRLRGDYRDFRLDRIRALHMTESHFTRYERQALQEYLADMRRQMSVHFVSVRFHPQVARFTHEQRVGHGFIEERVLPSGWVEMDFLSPSLEYLGRWLLGYTDAVHILSPDALHDQMRVLLKELSTRYAGC